MKISSSRIKKIVCSLIVVLTLSLVAPGNNFVMANDGTASETMLASIMNSYSGKNVYVKNGLSIDMGEELNYKELLQPEEYEVKFTLNSSDESIVAITETGIIHGQAPGTAFITLESNYGVYIYEVYVKMPQISLYSDNLVENQTEVTPKAPKGNYKVFIDPGHGGSDPGAVANGIKEKDINLPVALKVQMILKARGIDVVMSRDTDRFLELREISAAANASGSDVFVSIHANSASPGAYGIETFYYEGKTASMNLANNVQTNVIKSTGAYNRKVKTQDFHVIRETNMPSALVETGFITNVNEATLLKTDSYQQLLAVGIVNGIEQYLKANIALTPTPGERIYGLNRYETSYQVSSKGWTSADTVILALGADYPDALCAAPLATKLNAPILLTENISINKQQGLVNELKRLGAKKAVIIGGTSVLSTGLENEIRAIGLSTERIGGLNRYETSVLIAQKVGNNGEVAIANARGFADALSISAVAAQREMPIILVDSNQIPAASYSYLKNNNLKKVYAIGGPTVIGDVVVNQLSNVTRLGGNNRYETNKIIFDAFKNDIDKTNMYIALGNNFPDALSISALAGKTKSFVSLANMYGVETPLIDLINHNRNEIARIYVLGGPDFITDKALSINNIILK